MLNVLYPFKCMSTSVFSTYLKLCSTPHSCTLMCWANTYIFSALHATVILKIKTKGCEKLCYNGCNKYNAKHIGKPKIILNCPKRSTTKWMGELYTDLKKENPESKFNHNHYLSDKGKNVEKTLRIIII